MTLWKRLAYRWPVTCRGAASSRASSCLRHCAETCDGGSSRLRPPGCRRPLTQARSQGLNPRRRRRDQAHVPAEQPPPPQGARFPPADAHPRRPRHPVLAASQGPQQASRLTRTVRPATVLPAAARLTSSESFRRCVRSGRRAGSRTLVLHLDQPGDQSGDETGGAAQVGFVVSRAVGGAVVRNRVRRRLRHLVRDRLADLPAGSVVVVRALPAAAAASPDELRADLGRCLERVARTVSQPVVPPVMQP